MKIAWLGNDFFTSSGYGKQAKIILPRMRDAGHDVALLSNWGLQGGVIELEGIKCYPFFQAAHATDVLIPHVDNFFGSPKNGLVVSFIDIWPADCRPFALTHWAPLLPIDHDPLSVPVMNKLKTGDAYPLAISRFGEKLLKDNGFDCSYIPCVVETDRYQPGDKQAARRHLGIPDDAFVASMVAVNKGTPSRKSFPEAIQAFKYLLETHDDAFLYLHTEATGQAAGQGLMLKNVLDLIGVPKDRYKFCDQYKWLVGAPEEDMIATYQASDVLLAPSMAEGFGVPLVEAQACGVPVITTNFTSMPELCAAGWLVDGQLVYIPLGSWVKMPFIPQITQALFEAYDRAGDPELARKAREFALAYDADLIYRERWEPLLQQLEQNKVFADRVGDELKWFKDDYGLKLSHRYPTMLLALEELRKLPSHTIVETGTTRSPGYFSTDGCSTIIFGAFAQKHGGAVHSIDSDAKAIAEAVNATAEFAGLVTFHHSDSVALLTHFPQPIDLLYLDSYDCMKNEAVSGISQTVHLEPEAQEHQLRELQAAWNKLRPGSIVLLDDNSVGYGGKTKLAKEFLEQQGAECLRDAYQSLWRIR